MNGEGHKGRFMGQAWEGEGHVGPADAALQALSPWHSPGFQAGWEAMALLCSQEEAKTDLVTS